MRYKLNVRLQVLRLSLSDDGITYDGEHPIGNDPNDGTALAIAFDPDDGSESYAYNIELYTN